MSEFARPFRVTYPQAEPYCGLVYHGAQFPDGRCVVALRVGGFQVAVAFEHLPIPDGSTVEWQDGGQP